MLKLLSQYLNKLKKKSCIKENLGKASKTNDFFFQINPCKPLCSLFFIEKVCNACYWLIPNPYSLDYNWCLNSIKMIFNNSMLGFQHFFSTFLFIFTTKNHVLFNL